MKCFAQRDAFTCPLETNETSAGYGCGVTSEECTRTGYDLITLSTKYADARRTSAVSPSSNILFHIKSLRLLLYIYYSLCLQEKK